MAVSGGLPAKYVACDVLRQRMRYLLETRYWVHTYRQAEALEHVERDSGLIIVARDKPHSQRAAYEYYATTLCSLWDSMLRLPPSLCNYYEWITDRQPCHFYIDCEYYPDFNDDDEKYPFEQRRRLMLEMFVEQIGKWCDADTVRVFEMDASKKNKNSRHYVFHVDGHLFKNQYHCGAMQRHVQLAAIRKYGAPLDNPLFGWLHAADHTSRLKGTAVMSPIFDHGVYTRSRIFRVPWATKWKPGEYRPLRPLRRWTARRVAHDSMDVEMMEPEADPPQWRNASGSVECECFETDGPDMLEMNLDMFLEGMVQAYTDSFLETCADERCAIIYTREIDGGEPVSSTILLTNNRLGKTVSRRGLGNVALPNLLQQNLIGIGESRRNLSEKELQEQYGDTALISHAEANRIRAAQPIVHNRRRLNIPNISSAADANGVVESTAANAESEINHESLDLDLATFANDETMASESAKLCIAAIDEILMLRQELAVVTRRETVMYYQNYGPSLVFSYQLRSGFCEICKYEHSSNHVKVVVQLQPYEKYCDENHPDAPVYYFKCYKRPAMRSPPRALPSYLHDINIRNRVNALRKRVNENFEVVPRVLLKYLLD